MAGLSATELRALEYRARSCDVEAVGQLVVPGWSPQWFHLQAVKLLNEVLRFARFKGARGGIPRLIISKPRRCGKTLFSSELTPATGLGCSPNLRVMATAYNRELVWEMVNNTKSWMGHENYKACFPTRLGSAVDPETGKTITAKDASAYFRTLVEHPDGSIEQGRGSYYAVGIKGGATGRGFDLGIIDDWVADLDQALSPSLRRRRENFYDMCFESGMEGSAALIAVQTLWTPQDFVEWLYETWTGQGFDVPWLRIPALYDPELRSDIAVKTTDGRLIELVDPRTEPTSLWEEKFSTPSLIAIRDGLIKRGRKYVWDAQRQQHPTGQGSVTFPKTRWRWFDRSFDLGTLQEIYLSVDPNSKASGRSFGCIGVWGVTDHPSYGVNFFRLDEARGHWDFPEFRQQVVRLWKKWSTALPRLASHPKSKILVEDKANGPALVAETVPEIRELRRWLMPLPKSRSKEACYREAKGVIDRDPDGDACVWLPLESFGRTETGEPLVTADWVTGEGGFIDECYAQQPLAEPNDRPDEMSQMLIYRIFGPQRLAEC